MRRSTPDATILVPDLPHRPTVQPAPKKNLPMSTRHCAAVVAAFLVCTPVTAHAAHVWRAERLPLAGDRVAGGGGHTATMSVAVDVDANVLHVDLDDGAATSGPLVVRIVGPAHGKSDDGVRLRREVGGREPLEWKFPESDQSEILGGQMVVDVDAANGAPLLHGRIERLIDSPGGASTTLLTVLAVGFALLSVAVVTTQRRAGSTG